MGEDWIGARSAMTMTKKRTYSKQLFQVVAKGPLVPRISDTKNKSK